MCVLLSTDGFPARIAAVIIHMGDESNGTSTLPLLEAEAYIGNLIPTRLFRHSSSNRPYKRVEHALLVLILRSGWNRWVLVTPFTGRLFALRAFSNSATVFGLTFIRCLCFRVSSKSRYDHGIVINQQARTCLHPSRCSIRAIGRSGMVWKSVVRNSRLRLHHLGKPTPNCSSSTLGPKTSLLLTLSHLKRQSTNWTARNFRRLLPYDVLRSSPQAEKSHQATHTSHCGSSHHLRMHCT